jgi:methylaspartate mutase sigma subunit
MQQKVILATIPSDSHCWNLVFMELFLKEQRFDVINLGPCTPFELILECTLKNTVSAIIISSVNGHAFLEAERLIKMIRKNVPYDIPVYLGGKLSTDMKKAEFYAKELENAGYTKAYSENDDMSDFKAQLKSLSDGIEEILDREATDRTY